MANNDPFEEFEFKPITEGLGFHKKKAASTAAEINGSEPLLKDHGFSLIEEEPLSLKSPLPRKGHLDSLLETPFIEPSSPATTTVDEILKNLQKNKRFEIDKKEQRSLLKDAAKEEYQTTSVSISAGFLDCMLVVAASLLCMIILLVITKADLIGSLTNPASDKMIFVATAGLFAAVNIVYMLVNRVFLGYTPGEWAFDQRVGQPAEMLQWQYPLKVLARTVLNIATGFILLPVVSSLFNRDFAGKITGTQLVKKV